MKRYNYENSDNSSDNSLDKIVRSSIDLFSKKWYSSVSVAEICRKSKISNGLFYHYFNNKEELIKLILNRTVNQIDDLLKEVSGETIQEKLSKLIKSLHDYTNTNKKLILVFREGQYRYFEYERKLVEIYKNTLRRIIKKDTNLSLYLFIFGGLRFSLIRNSIYNSNISIEALEDIILNGIFSNCDFDDSKIFRTIKIPDYKFAFKSKDKILEEGKKLFGQYNFDEVNISKIMEKSNLATGTFYKYFKSKEIFFEFLVEISGKQIRHFISENLTDDLNRLEKEIRGIFLFINYLNIDRNCYNIVREAEFVNKKKAIEYYHAFVKGYQKYQKDWLNPKKVNSIPYYSETVIEFLLGISHYFGIEYIFTDEKIDLPDILKELAIFLKEGIRRYLK